MFPKRKDLFDKWTKAMVAGATVDKPNYSPATKSHSARPMRKRKKNNKRRKRKKKD